MQIDAESRRIVRLEIIKAQNVLVNALPTGNYYDTNGNFAPAIFEFNRGRIQGMKDVLDLLETPTDTRSEENDEPDAA